MATKKPSPQAQQVTDAVLARLESEVRPPEGSQAALRLPRVDFKKLVPKLVGGLLEVAGIAQDGHLSPDEVATIAARIYDLIVFARGGTSPSL